MQRSFWSKTSELLDSESFSRSSCSSLSFSFSLKSFYRSLSRVEYLLQPDFTRFVSLPRVVLYPRETDLGPLVLADPLSDLASKPLPLLTSLECSRSVLLPATHFYFSSQLTLSTSLQFSDFCVFARSLSLFTPPSSR